MQNLEEMRQKPNYRPNINARRAIGGAWKTQPTYETMAL
jgi:hypothetical protein